MRSATTAKSDGQGDPPKGYLRDNSMKYFLFNFTLIADLDDVIAFKYSLLKAD